MEKAYRRPVTDEELASKLSSCGWHSAKATRSGGIRSRSRPFCLADFLFRIEANPPRPAGVAGSREQDPADVRNRGVLAQAAVRRAGPVLGTRQSEYRVSDIELASRLSYFLWASMPDAELMQVAKAKTLHEPKVLEAQVRRMLADPKAHNLVDNWAAQWLQLRNLGRTKPDPKKFPTVDDELLDAMRKETSLFIETIIKEDRSILDIIDAPFTFVNGPLARHYGIAGVDGEAFQRVTLDGEQRSGVLRRAPSHRLVVSDPTSPPFAASGARESLGTPPPRRRRWPSLNDRTSAPKCRCATGRTAPP